MKVIVTGGTGMVGKGVLLECLGHTVVSEVLSIGRQSIGISNPKLKELIHPDFSEFDSVKAELAGYDACFHCMGVSAASMNEEQYTKMTYGFTKALSDVLYTANSNMTFIYVSGQGTDSSEKGRQMWARVKGKTENYILNLGFKQAYAFRPGMIIPTKGVEPSSKLYRVLITNLNWLIKLTKIVSPNSVVSTDQIGVAMINATARGFDKLVVKPADILVLALPNKTTLT